LATAFFAGAFFAGALLDFLGFALAIAIIFLSIIYKIVLRFRFSHCKGRKIFANFRI
jgi:4-hydroxybenzoate polyprenyltransferase